MPTDPKRALAHLQDELDGVTLYLALADLEEDPNLAEIYRRLAGVEQKHADSWTAQLKTQGVIVPAHKPSWRTNTTIWLAKRFGVGFVLPSIAAREQGDAGKYSAEAGAGSMSGDEYSHARVLSRVTGNLPGGLAGGSIAQLEGRHKAGGGNALRAAVLGANDGLVSNMSLVMGVAGAAMDNTQILVTGLAGLLAGACSMALGEWLSVQSSRELYQKQIAVERAEVETNPQEEAEELALIYQSRGLDAAKAKDMADRIIGDQAGALEALTREELGIDPKELGGSAWEAAITSFLLFSIGAIIPVIPCMILSGMPAVIVSLVLSGGRQVLFGLAAAAITYGIGRLIGVSIGG
jgi:VIT1/CCC1 family predicted Fe2+/Mn2+ transporter